MIFTVDTCCTSLYVFITFCCRCKFDVKADEKEADNCIEESVAENYSGNHDDDLENGNQSQNDNLDSEEYLPPTQPRIDDNTSTPLLGS